MQTDVAAFRKAMKIGHKEHVMVVSAASGTGTRELLESGWTMLRPKVDNWKPVVVPPPKTKKPKPANNK